MTSNTDAHPHPLPARARGEGVPHCNDVALDDERAVIGRDALHASGVVKLSLGRKRHVLLRAV